MWRLEHKCTISIRLTLVVGLATPLSSSPPISVEPPDLYTQHIQTLSLADRDTLEILPRQMLTLYRHKFVDTTILVFFIGVYTSSLSIDLWLSSTTYSTGRTGAESKKLDGGGGVMDSCLGYRTSIIPLSLLSTLTDQLNVEERQMPPVWAETANASIPSPTVPRSMDSWGMYQYAVRQLFLAACSFRHAALLPYCNGLSWQHVRQRLLRRC